MKCLKMLGLWKLHPAANDYKIYGKRTPVKFNKS